MGHGGPFGAVVVVENEIVGRGWNQVVYRNDPTAHAEMLAIREACNKIGHFHLSNATLYSTCEPCPMCMSATYWAHINTLYYGASKDDAAAVGFNDRHIIEELRKPLLERDIEIKQHLDDECRALLQMWKENDQNIAY
jgi:tRNA(Arg) A34 adenosine deaminase TadA